MDLAIPLYDALISVQVPPEKAKAVVKALETEMFERLATKQDLASARTMLSVEINSTRQVLEARLDQAFLRTTVILGGLLVTVSGVALAAAKYWLP